MSPLARDKVMSFKWHKKTTPPSLPYQSGKEECDCETNEKPVRDGLRPGARTSRVVENLGCF